MYASSYSRPPSYKIELSDVEHTRNEKCHTITISSSCSGSVVFVASTKISPKLA